MGNLWKMVVLLTMLFFPVVVFAECSDPAGKTFTTTNCERMEMTLTFLKGVFGPYPTCQNGILEVTTKTTQSLIDESDGMVKAYFSYAWSTETCTAKLYVNDCETEAPVLWLYFNENTILFLDMPTFQEVKNDKRSSY